MKLAVLALLLSASCSSSAAPAGNPHVVYMVGFPEGSGEALLQRVVDVYKQRLAANASYRTDAKASTVQVELSVSAAFPEAKPERVLKAGLLAGETKSSCVIEPLLPLGELVLAEEEWLRLEGTSCERGLFGSAVVAHASGSKVHVFRDERVRRMLVSSGEFEILQEASDEFLTAKQTTRAAERERFEAWRKEHPEMRLRAFDDLAREKSGPVPDTLWRQERSSGEYVLLMRSVDLRYRFGAADIESVGFSQDSMGNPAGSFELKKARSQDFGNWTASILGRRMAIVVDDEILTLATVKSRLPGSGIIEGGAGGFTQAEVKALVESLRPSGLPRLPLTPLSLRVEFLR